MIEFFKGWTMNIVTLVLFIVLLEILVPSGRMKKLVSMASGFILIIAIINPFVGLFGKGPDLKDLQISASNYIDKKELEESSRVMEEEQKKQIVEVYRSKLSGKIEDCAREVNGISDAKADVVINEDYSSAAFGEIRRVYLEVKPGGKNSGIKPVERVQEVEISPGQKAEQNEEDSNKNTELRTQLEEKISRLLDISKDNVVVKFS